MDAILRHADALLPADADGCQGVDLPDPGAAFSSRIGQNQHSLTLFVAHLKLHICDMGSALCSVLSNVPQYPLFMPVVCLDVAHLIGLSQCDLNHWGLSDWGFQCGVTGAEDC